MSTATTGLAQRVVDLDDLTTLVGEHLGVSRWHTVTQHQVDLFAEATGDHQWIHTDPERARSGPFGVAVAHGYLTLSLSSMLLGDVLEVTGAAQVVNYGVGKVRFPAPVPVGSRVRMSVALNATERTPRWTQCAFGLVHDIEGAAKPACVAEIVFRYYRQET
jgi:acyl dehydratase